MKRVLVADDEPLLVHSLSQMLKRLGHGVLQARTGEQAIKVFRQERPHLTILDLELPDMTGIDVFKRLHALTPEHPVIILTGTGTEEMEIEARNLGVTEFVLKGVTFTALKDVVERLLDDKQPERGPVTPK